MVTSPNNAAKPDADDVEDFIDEDQTLTQDIKYKITTYGADFLVDGLVSRYKTEEVYVPDFQRSFVWKKPQASKFIESVLLGLPTPGIFLYKEQETNKFLIVDGLQRIITLVSFISGVFPTSDKVFRLEKVTPKFVGKAFTDLEPEDQRQINNTVIHATVFQQTDPPAEDDEKQSVYLVFQRLNSGGTPLQPQEIRAALYHGPLMDFLTELDEEQAWRNIYGAKSARRKDQELILRYLAFLVDRDKYEYPMVTFLNGFAARNRHMRKLDRVQQLDIFRKTFSFIHKTLGANAFRPKRSLNAAVFEAVAVTVSANALYDKLTPEEFKERYSKLVADKDFDDAVSKSTSQPDVVKRRFQYAAKILGD